ncbi:hypothetical protein SNOG_09752 [Parastagonospora nodorum SN15]|uniref:Uncharacterized protein n=1 Tax=Phaeosphaeria nodorum (strain SN15 / ATCC MYA-4574 / FGSC 10173) TaxID=321614 RepID=Q0UER2_PHANO|nr:hypothetical protein SNOG_09752 [Parastagonospora nodorum SN15]EAT83017.2 hypothetical protein SNOG_09752 [Parastagonospora nodorum SN15]
MSSSKQPLLTTVSSTHDGKKMTILTSHQRPRRRHEHRRRLHDRHRRRRPPLLPLPPRRLLRPRRFKHAQLPYRARRVDIPTGRRARQSPALLQPQLAAVHLLLQRQDANRYTDGRTGQVRAVPGQCEQEQGVCVWDSRGGVELWGERVVFAGHGGSDIRQGEGRVREDVLRAGEVAVCAGMEAESGADHAGEFGNYDWGAVCFEPGAVC